MRSSRFKAPISISVSLSSAGTASSVIHINASALESAAAARLVPAWSNSASLICLIMTFSMFLTVELTISSSFPRMEGSLSGTVLNIMSFEYLSLWPSRQDKSRRNVSPGLNTGMIMSKLFIIYIFRSARSITCLLLFRGHALFYRARKNYHKQQHVRRISRGGSRHPVSGNGSP